jgi:hypothetical protein
MCHLEIIIFLLCVHVDVVSILSHSVKFNVLFFFQAIIQLRLRTVVVLFVCIIQVVME